MSKQLQTLRQRHPEKIHAAYRDQDGVWIEFHPGWMNMITETHAIHEDTVREALAAWKWTRRCSCEWCVKAAPRRAGR
jgi:hypothetical protein